VSVFPTAYEAEMRVLGRSSADGDRYDESRFEKIEQLVFSRVQSQSELGKAFPPSAAPSSVAF
jgi:hypothetical protein